MWQIWSGVLQNVLANILIALTVWLSAVSAFVGINTIRRRGLFAFFGLTKGNTRLICYISTLRVKRWGALGPGGITAAFFGLATPSYETEALVPFVGIWSNPRIERFSRKMRRRLSRWWILRNVQPEIIPSPEVFRGLKHGGSIVAVGSRAYNVCTAYLHDVVGTELAIGDRVSVMRAGPTGQIVEEWRYAEAESTSPGADFAILERVAVEATSTTYFVAAGLTTVGTTGAVYFLANHWRDLYRIYGAANFAVCLRFENIEKDPASHLKPSIEYISHCQKHSWLFLYRRRSNFDRLGLSRQGNLSAGQVTTTAPPQGSVES